MINQKPDDIRRTKKKQEHARQARRNSKQKEYDSKNNQDCAVINKQKPDGAGIKMLHDKQGWATITMHEDTSRHYQRREQARRHDNRKHFKR